MSEITEEEFKALPDSAKSFFEQKTDGSAVEKFSSQEYQQNTEHLKSLQRELNSAKQESVQNLNKFEEIKNVLPENLRSTEELREYFVNEQIEKTTENASNGLSQEERFKQILKESRTNSDIQLKKQRKEQEREAQAYKAEIEKRDAIAKAEKTFQEMSLSASANGLKKEVHKMIFDYHRKNFDLGAEGELTILGDDGLLSEHDANSYFEKVIKEKYGSGMFVGSRISGSGLTTQQAYQDVHLNDGQRKINLRSSNDVDRNQMLTDNVENIFKGKIAFVK